MTQARGTKLNPESKDVVRQYAKQEITCILADFTSAEENSPLCFPSADYIKKNGEQISLQVGG